MFNPDKDTDGDLNRMSPENAPDTDGDTCDKTDAHD